MGQVVQCIRKIHTLVRITSTYKTTKQAVSWGSATPTPVPAPMRGSSPMAASLDQEIQAKGQCWIDAVRLSDAKIGVPPVRCQGGD
jgi:hypothetical protein